MKKAIFAFVLVLLAFGVFTLKANADETGNLVIHYQNWNDDYDGLGSWAWGGPAAGKLKDGVDDFGAYWEYNNIPVGTSVGFIAVTWDGTEGPDWGKKQTEDINISASAIIAGQTTHVYVFEGAETTDDDPAHFIASNEHRNVLAVYYDSSGAYEENIGVHPWGYTAPESWGEPVPFTNAGQSEAGVAVKGIILHATEDWAGFLVYAGDDTNKKTGDLKPETGFFTDGEPGDVEVVYIVSKGNGYESNDNVYRTVEDFTENAFSFNLVGYNPVEQSGTFAVDPNTVFVITGALIASPYPDAEDKEAARATIEGWFAIREIAGETHGDPLEIERVDFATTNETLNSFVVILAEGSELDPEKEYELFFDNGELEASLELDLDAAPPEIIFIAPTAIVGKPAEERIITVPWGQPFNFNLFPRYRAADDRDGDITPFVYVPDDSPNRFVDTRTEGDYTIVLRVSDRWGNVTEVTFIFRVAKES